jgi:hypothetical protein
MAPKVDDLCGETNQWYPDLVENNHFIEPPASPEPASVSLMSTLAIILYERLRTLIATPSGTGAVPG